MLSTAVIAIVGSISLGVFWCVFIATMATPRGVLDQQLERRILTVLDRYEDQAPVFVQDARELHQQLNTIAWATEVRRRAGAASLPEQMRVDLFAAYTYVAEDTSAHDAAHA